MGVLVAWLMLGRGVMGMRCIYRLLSKSGDTSTWSGIIQDLEGGKAGKRPAVDNRDLVNGQAPAKARYEQSS